MKATPRTNVPTAITVFHGMLERKGPGTDPYANDPPAVIVT